MDFTIALVISLTAFFGYVIPITLRYGVQKSISYTFYLMDRKYAALVFLLFCVGFSTPIPFMALGIIPPKWIWLLALCTGSFWFVGAASHYELGKQPRSWVPRQSRKVHLFASWFGVLSSQVLIGVVYGYWGLNIVFISISLILILARHYAKIYWIEVMAYTMFICVLIFRQYGIFYG